nr:MAG TPA: hypothetical protein [Caudoviricetes sp.]
MLSFQYLLSVLTYMHECKNVKEINMVISPGFEPYFYVGMR